MIAVTDPGRLKIHGKLRLPEGNSPKTVILALHGITYTNSYWNAEPPVDNADDYNFSSAMTEGGYAVLAIDRLGSSAGSIRPRPTPHPRPARRRSSARCRPAT